MKCYMCDKQSTSVEHVPPECFFLEGHKVNLITVPSCSDHNLRKSKDDEYVRSFIASALGNNSFGESMATTKVARSFEHSSGLVAAVFKDVQVIRLSDGTETGAGKINLDRWDTFFRHFANAIFFHDFKVIHSQSWEIITPSLNFDESRGKGEANPYDEINKRLLSLDFVEQKTSNPEIFRYFFSSTVKPATCINSCFTKGSSFVHFQLPAGVPPHNTADTDTLFVKRIFVVLPRHPSRKEMNCMCMWLRTAVFAKTVVAVM